MWVMIQKGGPLMYLLILCSVAVLTVIIERLITLNRYKIDVSSFMSKILEAVRRNRIMEAIELCERTTSPVAEVIKAGLLKHSASRQEIKEAMEEAALSEVPKLEKNLNLLATLAHVSPLIGLLGTVTGMVQAFQVIQEKATALNPVSPGDLAGGIWEALLTTVGGLSVAIPAIVAYNFLVTKVDNMIINMERAATELVQVLKGEK
ncbi:MAG: MotA/TolQ/ExbB proton channel family protein [Candidatus Omnitrophota bacterium]|nr:MAG: MotA/TolQ/ExbB proton channel family protein [Candidatus Omnitrophota bacterium]HDM08675.1 MotA/TolQ/ExbB proton channel family protein [Candidatus Omnitrophota bacterium]